MSETEGLVVDKTSGGTEEGSGTIWIDTKKYGSAIIIVILIVLVAVVAYCKTSEGFASTDGVAASRSKNQVRSDTEVDRTWNLKELERSVALINRKTGAQ